MSPQVSTEIIIIMLNLLSTSIQIIMFFTETTILLIHLTKSLIKASSIPIIHPVCIYR